MKDIIVVYSVKSTAMAIRSIVEKGGFHVSHVCALGSTALEIAHSKRDGVIVCPFVMSDMSSADLAEMLPCNFDVIALSKNGSEQYMGNMITLPVPINTDEFLQTVAVLATSRSSFTKRSGNDGDYIFKAKQALMGIKGMSEVQAHKYLQEESMKTGKKIVAVAMDILDSFA